MSSRGQVRPASNMSDYCRTSVRSVGLLSELGTPVRLLPVAYLRLPRQSPTSSFTPKSAGGASSSSSSHFIILLSLSSINSTTFLKMGILKVLPGSCLAPTPASLQPQDWIEGCASGTRGREN